MYQLSSQVSPLSVEKACSQWAESAVMSVHRNRASMGTSLWVSSPVNSPTPSLKGPVPGGNSVPVRLLAQGSDHWPVSGLYRRSVRPENPFVGKMISSKFALPSKCRDAWLMPGNSSHMLSGSRKSVRQRLAMSQVPVRKSKSFMTFLSSVIRVEVLSGTLGRFRCHLLSVDLAILGAMRASRLLS